MAADPSTVDTTTSDALVGIFPRHLPSSEAGANASASGAGGYTDSDADSASEDYVSREIV